MSKIYHLFFTAILAFTMFACSQNDSKFGVFLADNRPAVPVTYEGSTTFGHNPYQEVSIGAGGTFTVKLNIPASSGRTIREIKRVAVGTTALQPSAVNAATGVFLLTNVAGSGTSASFSTSLNQIREKYPTLNVSAPPAGTPFREIRFQMLVVLDNNDEIIPMPLHIRITQ